MLFVLQVSSTCAHAQFSICMASWSSVTFYNLVAARSFSASSQIYIDIYYSKF